MAHMRLVTRTEDETRKSGGDLMSLLVPELKKNSAVLVLLKGDFGAGKTQFVKGMAKELGIEEEVVSPSYVYVCEYMFKLKNEDQDTGDHKFVHVDAWRVKRAEDLKLIGVKDYIQPGNVVVVEWPLDSEQLTENAENLVVVKVDFSEISETEREIQIDFKA